MRRDDLIGLVVASLSRYLGSTMADASARGQSERLGLGETVSDAEIEALLAKIASGLIVFVGREKTDRAMAEIHAAVNGGKG